MATISLNEFRRGLPVLKAQIEQARLSVDRNHAVWEAHAHQQLSKALAELTLLEKAIGPYVDPDGF